MALIVGQMPMFGVLDGPVIDQTGLAGNYDFRIEFAPEAPGFDTSGPTFLEALREQVGLKLNPQKGPVDVIIVDHVERPFKIDADQVERSVPLSASSSTPPLRPM